MKGARYLLRIDDITPTMAWSVFDEIERVLDAEGVRPIVAVVPDNKDAALDVEQPRADFWDRVRSWQAKGWTIGLHGHRHQYVTRHAGLVGINTRSEFAGLPRAEQEFKIAAGLRIFREQGVRADAFVAPAHSFDRATIDALLQHDIRVLSDGHFRWPRRDRAGMVWVPQQLWRFRDAPPGLWTVCLHVNKWSSGHVERLASDLRARRAQMTSLPDALDWAPPRPAPRLDPVPFVYRTFLRARRGIA